MSDAFQIVFIGLGTGFGSAMGAEFARFLVEILREQRLAKKGITLTSLKKKKAGFD